MIWLIQILFLLWASMAWADDLGCFVIGTTVPLPPHYINSAGVSTAATSKEAKIYRGTTAEGTISDGSFTQRDATNRPGEYVVNWDSTGKTAGRYTTTYRGTLDGSARDGGDDQFQLAAVCPPDANAVQWLGSALATPDTAGYPKVTLKCCQGPGELNFTLGIVRADVSTVYGNEPAAGSMRDFFNGNGYHGGGILVHASTGATSWVIPLQESTIITDDDMFHDNFFICGNQWAKIDTSVNSTPDRIILDAGNRNRFKNIPANGDICFIQDVR